jgi:hypothetical protein
MGLVRWMQGVSLTSVPGSKANISEIAELLSEFTAVPLQVNAFQKYRLNVNWKRMILSGNSSVITQRFRLKRALHSVEW